MYWWKRLIDQGHVPSQYKLGYYEYKLGFYYFYGFRQGDLDFVQSNYKNAIYWLEQAGYKGLYNAQYLLGILYQSKFDKSEGKDKESDRLSYIWFGVARICGDWYNLGAAFEQKVLTSLSEEKEADADIIIMEIVNNIRYRNPAICQ